MQSLLVELKNILKSMLNTTENSEAEKSEQPTQLKQDNEMRT